MSITFEQLLTDPKYREMTEQQLCDTLLFAMSSEEYNKLILLIPDTIDFKENLYNHLQKLKAESEKKAEPNDLVEKLEYKKFFSQGLSETTVETKHAHIQITYQKAREIAAKHFNCNPNEIKIV